MVLIIDIKPQSGLSLLSFAFSWFIESKDLESICRLTSTDDTTWKIMNAMRGSSVSGAFIPDLELHQG